MQFSFSRSNKTAHLCFALWVTNHILMVLWFVHKLVLFHHYAFAFFPFYGRGRRAMRCITFYYFDNRKQKETENDLRGTGLFA